MDVDVQSLFMNSTARSMLLALHTHTNVNTYILVHIRKVTNGMCSRNNMSISMIIVIVRVMCTLRV